jgi:pimeloyl-ACP methyl ester carboxylesterase
MVATARQHELSPGSVTRLARDQGVELALESRGATTARTVLFAHGFGQTRHAWSNSADALARAGMRCIAVDGRGHGDSGWNADGAYHLDQFVADAVALAQHAGEAPIWIGASMGGLLGMVAAAENPGLIGALVLVDITPRWEAAGVDRILSFMRAQPEGFASLAEAQAAVKQYLPHRASRKAPERLEKLLVRKDDGRLRWHWDPRLLDTVAQEAERWSGRLARAARGLDLPVLLVSGGQSDVVSEHTIAEFLALAPHAEHERIDHATHMVAGDDNDAFAGAVKGFLVRRGLAPALNRGLAR